MGEEIERSLRDRIKGKAPATFNAAEWETYKILSEMKAIHEDINGKFFFMYEHLKALEAKIDGLNAPDPGGSPRDGEAGEDRLPADTDSH